MGLFSPEGFAQKGAFPPKEAPWHSAGLQGWRTEKLPAAVTGQVTICCVVVECWEHRLKPPSLPLLLRSLTKPRPVVFSSTDDSCTEP